MCVCLKISIAVINTRACAASTLSFCAISLARQNTFSNNSSAVKRLSHLLYHMLPMCTLSLPLPYLKQTHTHQFTATFGCHCRVCLFVCLQSYIWACWWGERWNTNHTVVISSENAKFYYLAIIVNKAQERIQKSPVKCRHQLTLTPTYTRPALHSPWPDEVSAISFSGNSGEVQEVQGWASLLLAITHHSPLVSSPGVKDKVIINGYAMNTKS